MSKGKFAWWTFAGKRANAAIAERLKFFTGVPFKSSNLSIESDETFSYERLNAAIESLREDPPVRGTSQGLDKAIEELKFSACLPQSLSEEMLQARLADEAGVLAVLSEHAKSVSVKEEIGRAWCHLLASGPVLIEHAAALFLNAATRLPNLAVCVLRCSQLQGSTTIQ